MTFERTRDNLVDDFSAVLAEAEDLTATIRARLAGVGA